MSKQNDIARRFWRAKRPLDDNVNANTNRNDVDDAVSCNRVINGGRRFNNHGVNNRDYFNKLLDRQRRHYQQQHEQEQGEVDRLFKASGSLLSSSLTMPDFKMLNWSHSNPQVFTYRMKPSWATQVLEWVDGVSPCPRFGDKKSEEKDLMAVSLTAPRLAEAASVNYPLSEFKLNSELIQCKSRLDYLPAHLKTGRDSLYNLARELINPFEDIGKMCFQNRSAVKLLEMDYLLNGAMIKNHAAKDFHFLDLCGAPGGFSECIFKLMATANSRAEGQLISKRSVSGIGVTLKEDGKNGALVWNLAPVIASSCGYSSAEFDTDFHPMYADLTDFNCIRQVRSEVEAKTRGKMCNLIVADGGFDVSGREMEQETLHHGLILGEYLTAIISSAVGDDTHFFCKIFDSTHNLTKHFIMLTSHFFKRFTIVKLSQSRPASSERFILFQGRLSAQEIAATGCDQIAILAHMGLILSTLGITQLDSLKQPSLRNVEYLNKWLDYFQSKSDHIQIEHLTALQETLQILDSTNQPQERRLTSCFAKTSSSSPFELGREFAREKIKSLEEFMEPSSTQTLLTSLASSSSSKPNFLRRK